MPLAQSAGMGSARSSFASRVMQSRNPTIAAVGPIARLENHTKFASRFGTLANAAE